RARKFMASAIARSSSRTGNRFSIFSPRMSSLKQLKTEQKVAGQQLQVIQELETLVNDIERAETTINTLKTELDGVNAKHQGRKTTRDDIAYLTDLLKCANKKLA